MVYLLGRFSAVYHCVHAHLSLSFLSYSLTCTQIPQVLREPISRYGCCIYSTMPLVNKPKYAIFLTGTNAIGTSTKMSNTGFEYHEPTHRIIMVVIKTDHRQAEFYRPSASATLFYIYTILFLLPLVWTMTFSTWANDLFPLIQNSFRGDRGTSRFFPPRRKKPTKHH